MRRFSILFSVLCVAALLSAPSTAQTCTPSTSDAPTLDVNGRTIYVVVDPSACDGCAVGAHVILYEESNEIGGLQRDDARRDDTCGQIDPDRQFSPV